MPPSSATAFDFQGRWRVRGSIKRTPLRRIFVAQQPDEGFAPPALAIITCSRGSLEPRATERRRALAAKPLGAPQGYRQAQPLFL